MCKNLNHGRKDAPVRFCPSCGGIVNDMVKALRCTTVRHDVQRRSQSAFCVDCGERLQLARR
jgi:ribosomal protein L34E